MAAEPFHRPGEFAVARDALRDLRGRMGYTAAGLSRAAGLDEHFVSRLEGGKLARPGLLSVVSVARVLGVPVEALVAAPGGGLWATDAWERSGVAHGGAVRDALDTARSSIAATQAVESFMIPPEMLAWIEADRAGRGSGGGPPAAWLDAYRRHARRVYEAKHDSQNRGVTILRAAVLDRARRREGDWLRDMARLVGPFGERVGIVFAGETLWRRLDRDLRRAAGVGRWHKALAVDQAFAAVWVTPEYYRHTRCPGCVGAIRAALDGVAAGRLRGHADTQRALERIARGMRP